MAEKAVRASASGVQTLQQRGNAERASFRQVADPITLRMDLKIVADDDSYTQFDVIADQDDMTRIMRPDWYRQNGTGVIVESWRGDLDLSIRSQSEGRLRIVTRGRCVRDANGTPTERWVRVLSLAINGEEQLDGALPVWHDKPHTVFVPVSKGDIVRIQASWGA